MLAGVDFRNVGPGLGRARREAARSRRQGRRDRRRRSAEVVRPAHDQAGRLAPARSTIPSSIRCGRRSRASTCRRSSTPRSRRNSSSRWTTRTSAGSSSRCSRIAATTSPGQVTFEQLMTERNNMFRKHPKTRFVAAHFGWHANDLQRAGEDARRVSERDDRGRRDPLRSRPPAARRARVLREVPGPDHVRQGFVPAGGVSATTGACSRPRTNTSTTTATTTRSGRCTGCRCRTTC